MVCCCRVAWCVVVGSPPVPSRLQPLPPMTTDPINPYDAKTPSQARPTSTTRQPTLPAKSSPTLIPQSPFYNPEDDGTQTAHLPFMIQLDRRRHARATILPSTPVRNCIKNKKDLDEVKRLWRAARDTTHASLKRFGSLRTDSDLRLCLVEELQPRQYSAFHSY